jgi:nitrate/nitrite transporter NarK
LLTTLGKAESHAWLLRLCGGSQAGESVFRVCEHDKGKSIHPVGQPSGAGSAAAFGRIGGIVGPYAVGLLLPTWGAGIGVIFTMFAAIFLVIAAVVFILGEETRGSSLEQKAK